MRVLFDGDVHVHYRFLLLQQEDDPIDVSACLGGQVNGLCGAAQTGGLGMITGLHTGEVPVRVEAHEQAPPVSDEWEEVVEASLAVGEGPYVLAAFDVGEPVVMPEPGTYRVRWHASGMDAASDLDVRMTGTPAPDRYLLQLWPAPPAADTILRRTSAQAAYWHSVARETPPPPTAAEIAARQAAVLAERRRQDDARRAAEEVRSWGGSAPTAALVAIGGRTRELAVDDRDLVDTLAALPPSRQRTVAVWAARRACELAGIADQDWVLAGLTAAAEGVPLPPPWQDWEAAWSRLHPPPPGGATAREATAVITFGLHAAAPQPPRDPGVCAIDAVLLAGGADPAAAAMGAVHSFVRSGDTRTRVAEVRSSLRL
ncbi:hypothetical protein WEH80_34190 [Actinomycetes bacterium KLBMP 9759]